MTSCYEPYQPQLVPAPWADRVWTVEGPEVDYRLAGISIPCPTRMTVVQLVDGTLWLHSPVQYSAELALALGKLGPISALVAPNSYHYLQVDPWAKANPDAKVFAVSGAVRMIEAEATLLTAQGGMPWSDDIAHNTIALGQFTEAVFFHALSRTLIVTDLMQNFEAHRIRRWSTRTILKVGGATGPNGQPSIEIRLAARRHREALRAGLRQMLRWQAERIIIAHGACFAKDAEAEIRRAFAWVD